MVENIQSLIAQQAAALEEKALEEISRQEEMIRRQQLADQALASAKQTAVGIITNDISEIYQLFVAKGLRPGMAVSEVFDKNAPVFSVITPQPAPKKGIFGFKKRHQAAHEEVAAPAHNTVSGWILSHTVEAKTLTVPDVGFREWSSTPLGTEFICSGLVLGVQGDLFSYRDETCGKKEGYKGVFHDDEFNDNAQAIQAELELAQHNIRYARKTNVEDFLTEAVPAIDERHPRWLLSSTQFAMTRYMDINSFRLPISAMASTLLK